MTASAWQEAVVERIERRTTRVLSVFLRGPLARHQAGQHVDVRLVAEDGYEARRSYSIASAPGDGLVELMVERLDDGEVSPFFHDVLQPGDTLELRGPIGGHFVWHAALGGPLLLVAGGSGIAPLMAMLRERRASAPDVETLLLYSARTWDELVVRDEILQPDAALMFVAATTREPPRRPVDQARRVDPSMLHELLARWGRMPRHVYVCGATGFVETVTAALVAEGLPPPAIRAERYGGA